MRVQLNDLVLRKTSAEAARKELWDTQVDGFGVRVSATGRKVFFLVYRERGVKRRLKLGTYPAIGLAEARKKAVDFRIALERGELPTPNAREATPRTPKTFMAAVDDYLELFARQHNRLSTQNEKRWLLRNTCGGRWCKKVLADVTKQDVVDLLDEYVKAGKVSGANHILSRLRTFFTWCEERGLIDANPCEKLRKPGRTSSRERVLSVDELARIWRSAESVGHPYGPIVKLLILTGQRRNEVVGMQWQEINLDAKSWTLPKERTKNGIAHRLPLSEQALALIEGLPATSDTLVFPSDASKRSRRTTEGMGVVPKSSVETTFSGFSKLKAELDKRSVVKGWTLHDLRRSAATHMARLGVAPHVVEKILNHVSGTFGGVAGIYNHHDYDKEMREGLELWAAEVERWAAHSNADVAT